MCSSLYFQQHRAAPTWAASWNLFYDCVLLLLLNRPGKQPHIVRPAQIYTKWIRESRKDGERNRVIKWHNYFLFGRNDRRYIDSIFEVYMFSRVIFAAKDHDSNENRNLFRHEKLQIMSMRLLSIYIAPPINITEIKSPRAIHFGHVTRIRSVHARKKGEITNERASVIYICEVHLCDQPLCRPINHFPRRWMLRECECMNYVSIDFHTLRNQLISSDGAPKNFYVYRNGSPKSSVIKKLPSDRVERIRLKRRRLCFSEKLHKNSNCGLSFLIVSEYGMKMEQTVSS